MITLISLLLLIQIKHFAVDFLWQPEWMWKNKGTLLHIGGIAHAFAHAAVSFAVLFVFPFSIETLLLVCTIEFFAHYFIDFAKMNINRIKGLTPNAESFWILLGLDQFFHQATYIGMIAILIGSIV